jgi:hypothetical protein
MTTTSGLFTIDLETSVIDAALQMAREQSQKCDLEACRTAKEAGAILACRLSYLWYKAKDRTD